MSSIWRAGVGRHGQRGGVCSRSPRARALGLVWVGGGVARVISPALHVSAAKDAVAKLAGSERHRSPRREPGDCDVAHQLVRARLSGVVYLEWHGRSGLHRGVAGGVAFAPAVPGLAPGACMGQGEGLPLVISPAL